MQRAVDAPRRRWAVDPPRRTSAGVDPPRRQRGVEAMAARVPLGLWWEAMALRLGSGAATTTRAGYGWSEKRKSSNE